MVCAVIKKMDFLVALFSDVYSLTFVLVFLVPLVMYCYRSKAAGVTPPTPTRETFESLVATQFSDSCSANWPLAAYNRFRVGGNAEFFFRPNDLDQLLAVLKAKPRNMKVTPLGMGSNVLIRDGGVPGLVVQIVGRGFAHFEVVNGPSFGKNVKVVECGAGISQLKFAKLCAKVGISGLEFFCGIPGTIGGALRMNAGAHGTEMSDCLLSATVVDPNGGRIHVLKVSEMEYSYRHCGLPEDWIFVAARFKGDYLVKSREEIECTIDEMMAYREDAQPVNEKTAGCTFANPIDSDSNCSAWQLIAEAGCHGRVFGGAQVSAKHCNFLVNTGSATAEDLEALGESVQEDVQQKTGVKLNWEVKRIGVRL